MIHARCRQTCPPVQKHEAAWGSAGVGWRSVQREPSYWEAAALCSLTWGSGVLARGFCSLPVPSWALAGERALLPPC